MKYSSPTRSRAMPMRGRAERRQPGFRKRVLCPLRLTRPDLPLCLNSCFWGRHRKAAVRLGGRKPSTPAALTGGRAEASPSLFQILLLETGRSCGHLGIPNYCAGVQALVEMQMQVTKQCNKNKPIYLMWREAGLNTGSVAVLSQMGLVERGLSLPHCKCLLAMPHDARYGSVELRAVSLWGSNVSPRNAEEMFIGASSKNVSVERVQRSHNQRLRALT